MKGVTAVSGFQIKRSFVDTPDLDSDFTSNILGERKADNSSLTFKDKRNSESQDIRDALTDGTEGFMIYMPYGDIPGSAARRGRPRPVASTTASCPGRVRHVHGGLRHPGAARAERRHPRLTPPHGP
jgi:hypothetical protein